jgi:cyclopropane-fatty-acyl-phospholipid synthase
MRPALCGPERPVDSAGAGAPGWSVAFDDGSEEQFGEGAPRFTFRVPTRKKLEWVLDTDAYSAGAAFVRGEFDVRGDLEAAIRFKGWQPRGELRKRAIGAVAHWTAALESRFETRTRAARHIRFHYDRSNDFYRLFLDPRMVYSCGYFRRRETALEDAQVAKLEHICRKLELRAGERFLDIGCGWGALLEHAADRFDAIAMGCTLSRAQHDYAAAMLGRRAIVLECDYRDLSGVYDKIASVGMFEHAGPRHARGYFRKMAELMAPEGLLLHHAIKRFRGVGDDASTLFVRRHIFPGGRLMSLDETVRAAEESGLEVVDVENLRPHYALTCRRWRERLEANGEAALRCVDEATFRAWRIWLAGSALSFEEGWTSVYQVLLGRRGAARGRLTREHMYADGGRGERS